MSTTSSTINKKNKKSRNDNDMNKDRNSNMPSTKKQPPLFEQFNAIVENGKQQNTNSNKKHSQKTRGCASVQRCDSESSQTTNKRQKITQPPNLILGEDSNYHSGSSYDEDDGDDEIPKPSHNLEDKSDSANANKESSDSDGDDSENEASVSNNEIEEAVDSVSVDTNTDEKNDTNKKTYEPKKSVLSPVLTTSLQWYVRNTLFQRVKIIDETHLEGNGQIIQEALDTIKIDKSSIHIQAYVNDCRRVIKRAMCSRRGYVKREVGKKLKSKCGSNL